MFLLISELKKVYFSHIAELLVIANTSELCSQVAHTSEGSLL